MRIDKFSIVSKYKNNLIGISSFRRNNSHVKTHENISLVSSKFVPKSLPPNEQDLSELSNFIKNTKNLFVLSGAGLSTESGDI